MKPKILAIALFVLTTTAVIYYPSIRGTVKADLTNIPFLPVTPEAQKIEVVFVLDTTSSMSGLIQSAKDKIWSIANTMAQSQPAPEIHMGLVAFRDRGDAYVTKVVDLSEDLDSMYVTLMDFQAQGGGDGAESVNQALDDAINRISWSQDSNSYKVVFLVGDAPPHMDYADDVKYPVTLARATKKGIIVNAIRCGENQATQTEWAKIARLSQGKYFDVDQQGGAVAMTTPFDNELAKLSAELDNTRLYFGNKEEKAKRQRKFASSDKLRIASSPEAQARRAAFNATKSGQKNLLGEGELVAAFEADESALASIAPDHLPEAMQELNEKEKRDFVEKASEKRKKLLGRIRALTDNRTDYIAEQIKDVEDLDDSLDNQIYEAVREQAAKKGLVYEDGPAY